MAEVSEEETADPVGMRAFLAQKWLTHQSELLEAHGWLSPAQLARVTDTEAAQIVTIFPKVYFHIFTY